MDTIEVFADETVFRNDDNGYTVLRLQCDGGDTVTVVIQRDGKQLQLELTIYD